MKAIKFCLLATILGAVFLTTGCNDAATTKTETTDKATPATTAADKPAAPAPSAFVPFKVMRITHTVKDFAAWKAVYDTKDSMRQAYGLSKLALCRDDANPNKVYVFLKAADIQKAKDFAANPALKADMQKAGVTNMPAFLYVDVVRFGETPIQKGRVIINHKVKDYDVWLKAYDAEGKATREANGLIDRGISRDISDPNNVYVTFAISDLAKAKARLANPAFKKLMTDAGVMGEPVIDFYTSVD
jgi:quinol monooxygenase YgiN